MEYTATFDIGTTQVKGILMDEKLQVCAEASLEIRTDYTAGQIEQEPKAWYAAFCTICQHFAACLKTDEQVTAVIMSGQMQDTIVLDGALEAVGRAILYSDARAGAQVETLAGLLGLADMAAVTGNLLDASLPLAKLLWLKEEQPERYARMSKVVFSSKDYIIARLTGQAVTDWTTAATTGLLDMQTRGWRLDWLEAAGLPPAILPQLAQAEAQVGTIHTAAAKQCGLPEGTAVYAGLGDAGAATLASGITRPGEINIHLGTSGWVAAISQTVLPLPSVFNLVAADTQYCINVVPFLNAGNVHAWAARIFAGGDYGKLQTLAAESTPGAGGVCCLPYLVGERYPVLDGQVRGSFLGVSPQTQAADLARAALEGVAFSIRQGLESLAIAPLSISLIGGGAQDSVWCQILADVLGQAVTVLDKSDYLPAMTLAAVVKLARGEIADYPALLDRLRQQIGCTTYKPSPEIARCYEALYTRYLRLYPALKAFYAE